MYFSTSSISRVKRLWLLHSTMSKQPLRASSSKRLNWGVPCRCPYNRRRCKYCISASLALPRTVPAWTSGSGCCGCPARGLPCPRPPPTGGSKWRRAAHRPRPCSAYPFPSLCRCGSVASGSLRGALFGTLNDLQPKLIEAQPARFLLRLSLPLRCLLRFHATRPLFRCFVKRYAPTLWDMLGGPVCGKRPAPFVYRRGALHSSYSFSRGLRCAARQASICASRSATRASLPCSVGT